MTAVKAIYNFKASDRDEFTIVAISDVPTLSRDEDDVTFCTWYCDVYINFKSEKAFSFTHHAEFYEGCTPSLRDIASSLNQYMTMLAFDLITCGVKKTESIDI